MSPTKPTTGQGPLSGLAATLAGLPQAQTPHGGMEVGFDGSTSTAAQTQQAPEQGQFAGMGPLLEDPDPTVFKTVNELVLRQELIALNHLAMDSHWTYVKLGYPWSTLTKDPVRDVYKQTLPYGSAAITTQAVPNKMWDLANKTTETLLVDFPEVDFEPADDSEQAKAACEMGNRFIAQDGGEQGTNDPVLFHDRVNRAMTCASTYIECWTDPTGGGYVPLQIKAHPEATDPNNPLIGPDGNPTTDYILRYVTEDGQFTDDAGLAAPQWRPKLMASKWGREHTRVFPETATVENAEKLIILGFCTIGEGKRRWESLRDMAPEDLSALCDWTPQRYLVLLPPFQRARWKLSDGLDKQRSGSSDERIFFYYHIFSKASPDHKRGADVVVTGALDGFVIDRKLNAKEVEVDKGHGRTKEIRCLEIPVVQITPVGDPDEQDPTGRAFVELFAGAVENNAHLSMSFSQIVDQILHTPWAISSTSPIEGWEVEDARASGDFLKLTRAEDKPIQLPTPALPTSFFNMYELADEAINSAAAQERAANGSETSKERSGKALQIAVQQNNVNHSGKQNAVNNAYARWCRIKVERCMVDFDTAQQISYVGEDGAYKQDEFTGVDFALIGKASIKVGTGTMMAPDNKVQYLGNLQVAQLIDPDEAKEAARPAFAKRLGLAPNPHQQYVDRCIDSWLEGPPAGDESQPGSDWMSQNLAYQQYQQSVAPQQQAYQMGVAQAQATGTQPPAPPELPAGPPVPWTPFTPRPNDTEPAIAELWMRKTSKVMSTVKYMAQPPEWRALLDQRYTESRQVVALAAQAAQGAQQPPGQPSEKEPKGQSDGTPAKPQQPNQQPALGAAA